MKALLFLALMFYGIIGQAEELKVLKVKGRKAIVKIPKGMDISKGDMLNVGGDSENAGGAMASSGTASRNNSIELGFEFSSSSTNLDGNKAWDTTTIGLEGSYGWNMFGGSMEFGPILKYSSTDIKTSGGSTKASSMAFGGFFDYNIFPNKPGQFMVPAAGITAVMTTGSSDNGTTKTDLTGMEIEVLGKVKFFVWNDSLAIVPALAYRMDNEDKKTSSTTVKDETSGFVIKAGIASYF